MMYHEEKFCDKAPEQYKENSDVRRTFIGCIMIFAAQPKVRLLFPLVPGAHLAATSSSVMLRKTISTVLQPPVFFCKIYLKIRRFVTLLLRWYIFMGRKGAHKTQAWLTKSKKR
mgnify:CR=1 FL=1